MVSLYRNSEQGLGIGELLAIPGRVVVVGQIDFQAIQLSRLYLKEEEQRVCVCVCITERESEGELSVLVCLGFEEGGSGEAQREFYFWSLSSISHILLSRCNIYHTYTCIQRASRGVSAVPSLHFGLAENPEPWGVGGDCSTHQHVAELASSTDQHVAESIRQSFCSVFLLEK